MLNKCETCDKELKDITKTIKKLILKKETIKLNIWIKWEDEGCGKKHLVIDSLEEADV